MSTQPTPNGESVVDDYPFHGTCDQCSEGPQALRSASADYPDAWICATCVAAHERALDQATDAVMRDFALFRSPRYGTELDRSEVREILNVAIVSYLAPEIDGSVAARSVGQNRRGTHSASTFTGPVAPFVEAKYRAGWRWLSVERDGHEVGGIVKDPNTRKRVWWAEIDGGPSDG